MTPGDKARRAELKRRKRAVAARLGGCADLIKGSLVVNRRKCGKPQCRCAEGQLHESLAFTFKQGGRSRLVHVPGELAAPARQAAAAYATLHRLVDEVSDINLALFKQAGKGRKTRTS
jgi:hypothetical protein